MNTQTLCWKCSNVYYVELACCPQCKATNANVDVAKAQQEMQDADRCKDEARLLILLKDVCNHSEGWSTDDVAFLCRSCGIDPKRVMIPQPTPDVNYQGNPDLNAPF